jgi:hypothetical protein
MNRASSPDPGTGHRPGPERRPWGPPAFGVAGHVAAFCDEVLVHDLPDLPAERRAEVVAFAGRRIRGLPSPMRIGVGAVAVAVAAAGRVVGLARLVRLLAARPLPVLGEYVRLVRSLGYAYVWETWPATTPTGGAGDPVG